MMAAEVEAGAEAATGYNTNQKRLSITPPELEQTRNDNRAANFSAGNQSKTAN